MLDLEKALSNFSEATINFEIKDKVVKTGILKNWKTHPMFIEFFLERPNKKDDRYKVQYPFDFEYHSDDGLLFLDYRVESFNKKFNYQFEASSVENIITDKKFDEILTISKVVTNG